MRKDAQLAQVTGKTASAPETRIKQFGSKTGDYYPRISQPKARFPKVRERADKAEATLGELMAFARAFSAFCFTDTENKLGYQWALKTLVEFKRQARLAIAKAEGRAQ